MTWLLVFLGGGLGAIARFVLASAVQGASDGGFPLGTLVVNLAGCALIGVLGGALAARGVLPAGAQLFLIPGLLGGFTTFSAFGLDVIRLWEAGQAGFASIYVLASVAGGIGAVAIAARIGRGLLPV